MSDAGMSERAITKRVKALGESIGVEQLPKGVITLQEAGGWNSLAMPRRYVEEATTANQGMD